MVTVLTLMSKFNPNFALFPPTTFYQSQDVQALKPGLNCSRFFLGLKAATPAVEGATQAAVPVIAEDSAEVPIREIVTALSAAATASSRSGARSVSKEEAAAVDKWLPDAFSDATAVLVVTAAATVIIMTKDKFKLENFSVATVLSQLMTILV